MPLSMDRILLDEWAMIGRDVTIRDNNGNHPIGIYGSRVHMPIVIGKHACLQWFLPAGVLSKR